MAKQAPPETEVPSVKGIYVQIDADLHRQLRIKAATEDRSIKDSVIAAIEAYVAT
jgi:predicted HicB family RNase H-like nuclease